MPIEKKGLFIAIVGRIDKHKDTAAITASAQNRLVYGCNTDCMTPQDLAPMAAMAAAEATPILKTVDQGDDAVGSAHPAIPV